MLANSAPRADPRAIRSAMPSLHAAWAVLVFLASRRQHWTVRGGVAAFLLLTLLATIGFGLHYQVDLVAALPLVLAVRCIAAIDIPWSRAERTGGLAVAALLIAVWFLLIRGFLNPAHWQAVVLGLVIVTVLVSIAAERLLWRAEAAYRRTTAPAADLAGSRLAYPTAVMIGRR